MNVPASTVFSLTKENAPLPGCTVSEMLGESESASAIVFSLAEHTDISAEIFPYCKLILMEEGRMEVTAGPARRWTLTDRDCILLPKEIPIGMHTETGAIYTEINIRRLDDMNEAIHAGEVFRLPELVPYQAGKIVNMDVIHNERMKLVVMSFDQGTGLSEHAAPGEALVFALDGEAVIRYEGSDHTIRAGENFHFADGGLHAIRANGRFKMALLLML